MSRSPISYGKEGQVVGNASLAADTPVSNANGLISDYFLLLTGIRASDKTKDVIKYYCTNHARHMVLQVYFTADEGAAVVMFSPSAVHRRPGTVALN